MNSPSDTPHSVAGFPAVFDIVEGAEVLDAMSTRESRILVGAANFHAFTAPGRSLRLHLYDGDGHLAPRTSDDRTFDGRSRVFRHRKASVVISSRVQTRPPAELSVVTRDLVAADSRHLYISPDAVLQDPPRPWRPTDPVRRALREFRNRAPLAYDQARDLELLRFSRALRTPADRRDYAREFDTGGSHEGLWISPAPAARAGARPAVLIGMHWFELGGAERWALETVRIVRDAGLFPIVISNVDSQHPFITRPELDGAMVIPLSDPTHFSQEPGAEAFLAGVLSEFELRGVIVHHNQWLYDRLPWIRASCPGVPVIDSTHIVEYRGGGYPMSSVRASRYIDVHHVISPSLREWMVDTQGVDSARVLMAPLGGLTTGERAGELKPRDDAQPLNVAFVGRMSRQKSPEIFVALARETQKHGVNARFIMHGDGELDDWVDDLVSALGPQTSLIRRTSSEPVTRTLDEADVLAITSHNEGLTLTTLEAVAHGIPVVSTDVGAQSDVVPAEGLFSRHPVRGVRHAADIITRLERDESARRALWESEKKMVEDLLSNEHATPWLTGVVSQW